MTDPSAGRPCLTALNRHLSLPILLVSRNAAPNDDCRLCSASCSFWPRQLLMATLAPMPAKQYDLDR
jgi:hypothetical protein